MRDPVKAWSSMVPRQSDPWHWNQLRGSTSGSTTHSILEHCSCPVDLEADLVGQIVAAAAVAVARLV